MKLIHANQVYEQPPGSPSIFKKPVQEMNVDWTVTEVFMYVRIGK